MEPKVTPPIRTLETKTTTTLPTWLAVVMLVVAGLLGGFGGWMLAGKSSSLGSTPSQSVKTNTSAGIKDIKRFPDSAEGILKEGGIDGEGSYHLERPGGVSQNVYLTSSIVDLSEYTGKKVKVQGETFEAQTAGWLMDVGYVELK